MDLEKENLIPKIRLSWPMDITRGPKRLMTMFLQVNTLITKLPS